MAVHEELTERRAVSSYATFAVLLLITLGVGVWGRIA